MDYLEKTIEAYNHAPDKFASATTDMVNSVEMNIMLKYLENKNLPILDVGCAYGRDCKIFTDLGYKIIGIDMSDELLSRAKVTNPELDLRKMDVRNLEFEDSMFGAAWCSAVLLHLNEIDLTKALKEIHRVLAPEGVIAVSMKEGRGEKEVVEKFSSELSRFYNFKTEELLNNIMQQCGFELKQSHVLNERERFGPDKRDLNWVWSFAVKK